MIRIFRWVLITAAFAWACLAVLTGTVRAEESPNVIVVVANDLSWDDLPLHASVSVKTPAIDRLAAEGMELQRFYVCPVGATTRACLHTGRYHYRTGVAGDRHGENVMHGYEITLAEVLRDNGYATGYFGRWESGRNWPSNARGQGFEVVRDHPGKLDDLGEAALDFCTSQGETTFLCWLALPPSAESGGVAALDAALGRLLDGIDAAELAENTIVVLVADNGSGSGREVKAGGVEGAASSSVPGLFGERGSVHEAGVRVPCLVRWPERIPAGSDSHEICTHIDLLPTLVELTASTFVETLPLDGISLAELLLSGGKPRRWPNRILFTAFTPPGYDTKKASVAVRTGRWLAVRDPQSNRAEDPEDRDGWELYDMLADPYQRYNVADEYWYLAGHLSADFSFWMMYTTENGLAPVANEVGHPEWPRVILHVDDLPYRAEVEAEAVDSSDHRALSWPVEVVEAGDYRVSIDWGEGVPISCEVRVVIGESEMVAAAFAEAEVSAGDESSQPGLLRLPRGVGHLELDLAADGVGKSASGLMLKAVIVEKIKGAGTVE